MQVNVLYSAISKYTQFNYFNGINPMLSKILVAITLVSISTAVHTSKTDKSKQDLYCMAANLYFEARGESELGQKAVAKVTTNRVKSKKYPNSVCKVVFQRKQFSWTHQEPWHKIQKALNGVEPSKNPLEVSAYQLALKTAKTSLKTPTKAIPDDALWYHADYVNPRWAKKMKKVKKVGSHIFYAAGSS